MRKLNALRPLPQRLLGNVFLSESQFQIQLLCDPEQWLNLSGPGPPHQHSELRDPASRTVWCLPGPGEAGDQQGDRRGGAWASQQELTAVPSLHRTQLALENLEDACVLTGPDDSLCDKHACPAYVGPEILSSRASYSGKAADVWSLGVALFTMLAGRYPFQDSEPALLFRKIRRGTYTLPRGLSAPARCLLRCLLRRDPAERLPASAILLHPWLRGNPAPPGPPRAPLWEADQVVPEAPGLEEVEAEEGEREEGLYG